MQPSTTVSFKRLRQSEHIMSSTAAMTEVYVLRDRRKLIKWGPKLQTMIGRDCTLLSTTAEEIIIIAPIKKTKEAADAENKQIGKKVKVKTDYPSATMGGK